MAMRKTFLETDRIYHVFTKSIAGYRIFCNVAEFVRMKEAICFYQYEGQPLRLSEYMRLIEFGEDFYNYSSVLKEKKKLVEIIAYCLMPTHLHLVVKQLKENGVSRFVGNTLNSYTRYFNIRHSRKGPLWQGKFKNVLVESTEELLHLTRYVHLNPVTAGLVTNAGEWLASSYKEYVSKVNKGDKICRYHDVLEINFKEYANFVEDMVDYYRQLAVYKSMLLD